MNLNYINIPSSVSEDDNREKTSWVNGKCVSMDLGGHIMVYLGHRNKTVYDHMEGESPVERNITEAFAVRVSKPVTRGKVISAAEMEAYGLSSAEDVSNLNASLSRKFRDNPEDKEVVEHDNLIRWVKAELDKINIVGSEGGDNTGIPVNHAYRFIRSIINKQELTPKEALSVKGFYPDWKPGIDVKVGEYYQDNGKLFVCDQQHTTQENWRPGEQTSLWHEVVKDHDGTMDDPIPYNVGFEVSFEGMTLEAGKFYTQGNVLYECTRDSGIPLVQNLMDLIGIYVLEVSV